ncbi:hypothetical protein ACROYT_G029839 [Oculina patagonica]
MVFTKLKKLGLLIDFINRNRVKKKRRVNTELALKCRDADLLILEGMGRAIHTNYEAKFTCDSIKLAVIKNRWLAQRLGGDMYSVVFKYEKGKKALFTV